MIAIINSVCIRRFKQISLKTSNGSEKVLRRLLNRLLATWRQFEMNMTIWFQFNMFWNEIAKT